MDVSIKVAAELVHYESISESSPKNICWYKKKRNLHIYQFSCPIKCAFLDLLKTITAQVSERQQINSFATRIFLGKFCIDSLEML